MEYHKLYEIIKHIVALEVVEYVLGLVKIDCYVMNADDLCLYSESVDENRELLVMLIVDLMSLFLPFNELAFKCALLVHVKILLVKITCELRNMFSDLCLGQMIHEKLTKHVLAS